METLKRIILETDEDEYSISTSIVRARTFLGAEKKLKDQDIQAIIKISNGSFMVFYHEEDQ
tara:strand:+ start:264 stop:446 length:183 start_codon:yes stop_codon:yes gene_type:complete